MLSTSRFSALRLAYLLILIMSLAGVQAFAQNTPLDKQVSSVLPDAQTLYVDLHEHPELSSHETRTAADLATRLQMACKFRPPHRDPDTVIALAERADHVSPQKARPSENRDQRVQIRCHGVDFLGSNFRGRARI